MMTTTRSIFGQLERPNELNSCIINRNMYSQAENSMVNRMWKVVKAYQQLNDVVEAGMALQALLGEFKDTVGTLPASLHCSLDIASHWP